MVDDFSRVLEKRPTPDRRKWRLCATKSAQQKAARDRETRLRHARLRSEFFDRLELIEMRGQLVQAGPALEVEAQHLVGAFGRLATDPESDQQAGDQRRVDLK